jgi:hypothetical protein
MKDEEGFLSRWSRRKRDAAKPAPEESKPEVAPVDAAPPVPAVDPATLPSIDLIGPDTDIKAFLAKGVPQGLTQAALRRAWAADPAIRDFVGLSENSWDFNAVGGVPGFGTIDADDVRKVLAQMLGNAPEEGPAQTEAPPAALPRPALPAEPKKEEEVVPPVATAAADDTEHPEPTRVPPPAGRRRHGGALPA